MESGLPRGGFEGSGVAAASKLGQLKDGEAAVGTLKNARIELGLGFSGYKARSGPSVSMP